MKEINISFLATATINQVIQVEDGVEITQEEMINGLNERRYLTTIGHPNPGVYQLNPWKRIGTIVHQEAPESNYSDFDAE